MIPSAAAFSRQGMLDHEYPEGLKPRQRPLGQPPRPMSHQRLPSVSPKGRTRVVDDTFASQPAPVPRGNGVVVGFPLAD